MITVTILSKDLNDKQHIMKSFKSGAVFVYADEGYVNIQMQDYMAGGIITTILSEYAGRNFKVIYHD